MPSPLDAPIDCYAHGPDAVREFVALAAIPGDERAHSTDELGVGPQIGDDSPNLLLLHLTGSALRHVLDVISEPVRLCLCEPLARGIAPSSS